MNPSDHALLCQLVQFGLEHLRDKASAALNGIAVQTETPGVSVPSEPTPDASPNPDNPQGNACENNGQVAQ